MLTADSIALTLGIAGLLITALRAAYSLLCVSRASYARWRQERHARANFRERLQQNAAAIPTHRLDDHGWQGKRKFRIAYRQVESADDQVVSFHLAPMDGRALPTYEPGQFLPIELIGNVSAKSVRRSYSLSETPAESYGAQQQFYRITIKRQLPPLTASNDTPAGLVSNFFHDRMQVGSVIDVRAPAGSFVLDKSSHRPVVFIAGGVGITPILSMLNFIIARQPEREAWLFFGVKNRSDHIFRDHLVKVRQQCPNVQIRVYYSQPTDACRAGMDYDFDGRVSVARMAEQLHGSDYQFYLCGPSKMMRDLRADLNTWGVPAGDVAFEAFGSASIQAPATPPPAAKTSSLMQRLSSQRTGSRPALAAPPVTVEFTRSGNRVTWDAAAANLLEFAEANGINAPYGCRAGGCGSCAVAVREGHVDYTQQPIVMPPDGTCLMCIAKPSSNLVIDL